MVRFFCVAYLYFPREAHHDFSLFRVLPEADAFKEDHKDLYRALCSQTGFLNPTSPS
jgi:hypothetical protein